MCLKATARLHTPFGRIVKARIVNADEPIIAQGCGHDARTCSKQPQECPRTSCMRKPIILAVSARTLLPVLIPARDPASLGPRLAAALAEILAALGIPADQIRDEQQQMAQIAFAPTSSRQILGTMNDFDRMLEPAPGQSLTSAALELAQAPCGPIGMDSPDRATVSLFANPSDTEH